MNTEHAKPGETIEITIDNGFLGRRYLAVDCPDDKRNDENVNCAWVVNPYGYIVCCVDPSTYNIVGRESATGDDTDAFLKRQLNDNLRKMFA